MDDNDKKSQSETQKDHTGFFREEFDKMKSDRKAIDRMYSHLKRYPGKPVPVSKPVAVVCAVSMITGFILICTGFFFHDSNSELEEILLMIGLVLAAGVSTVCYVIDRLLPKHLSEDEQEMLYEIGTEAEENKDSYSSNVSTDAPSKLTMILGGTATLLLAAALISVLFAHGSLLAMIFGGLTFTGMFMMSIAFRRIHNIGTAFSMKFITVGCLVIFILGLLYNRQVKDADWYFRYIAASYGLLLMASPLIYFISKKIHCTETVEALCTDIRVIIPKRANPVTYQGKSQYIPYWEYTYNGISYLHKDIRSHKPVDLLDNVQLKINPKCPHDVFRVKLPLFCVFYLLAGITLFGLSLLSIYINWI